MVIHLFHKKFKWQNEYSSSVSMSELESRLFNVPLIALCTINLLTIVDCLLDVLDSSTFDQS